MVRPARIIISLFLLFISTLTFANPIDINSADSEALAAALEGIGEMKAQAIVDYRQEHGPFQSVDDLINVKGIGEAIVEKNRSNMTIGTNAEEE